MAQAVWPLTQRKFGETTRRDAWWIQPLLVFLALSTFIVYATWAAFQGNHFEYGPYLSPFIAAVSETAICWFGPQPAWWPAALPFSAALLILWAPGGFRFLLLLSRAYYKASGPIAVLHSRRPRKKYWASARFPSCSRTCTATSSTWAGLIASCGGCHQGLLVYRCRRHGAFWYRDWKPGPDDQCGAARRIHLELPFAPPFDRRQPGRDLDLGDAVVVLLVRIGPEQPPSTVRVAQLVLGRLCGSLRAPLLDGRVDRLPDLLVPSQAHHKNLAEPCRTRRTQRTLRAMVSNPQLRRPRHRRRRAGLRAAIEASAAGVTVGLMQILARQGAHGHGEGGVAAALGNVDDRDSWKVPSPTRCGAASTSQLAHGRASCEEEPDRVRGLEAWGGRCRSHAGCRILQRNFGGHRYSRLAHVGDRTGSSSFGR